MTGKPVAGVHQRLRPGEQRMLGQEGGVRIDNATPYHVSGQRGYRGPRPEMGIGSRDNGPVDGGINKRWNVRGYPKSVEDIAQQGQLPDQVVCNKLPLGLFRE